MITRQELSAVPPKKRLLRASPLPQSRECPHTLVRLVGDEVVKILSWHDAGLYAKLASSPSKSESSSSRA